MAAVAVVARGRRRRPTDPRGTSPPPQTGWDTLDRPDSELYRGPRLDTALEWQAVDQPDLTVIEAAFLDASRALAESERSAQAARVRRDARQNRRVRRALVGVALFAVAVLIAGAIAVQQRRRADVASRDSAIRALVSNTASMRSARRDLAALLGVEAHRLAPSAATESALLGVFTSLPGIGTTRRFDEAVFVDNEGVVLPDGRTIAGVDVNGNVHLIDVSTGNDMRQLGDQRTPTANVKLAVSADGHFLAVADADAGRNSGRTMVNVWDLRTHQGRLVVADLPVAVGSIAISHDGSQVAIGGAADGRIQLRDARTGELQHELDAIRHLAMPRGAATPSQWHIWTMGGWSSPRWPVALGSSIRPPATSTDASSDRRVPARRLC